MFSFLSQVSFILFLDPTPTFIHISLSLSLSTFTHSQFPQSMSCRGIIFKGKDTHIPYQNPSSIFNYCVYKRQGLVHACQTVAAQRGVILHVVSLNRVTRQPAHNKMYANLGFMYSMGGAFHACF